MTCSCCTSHPIPPKITSIIFDIGNVLTPFDYNRAYDRFAALAPTDSLQLDHAALAALQAEVESGRITCEEFICRVRPLFSFTGSNEEFISIWEDIFDGNPPLHAFVAELAARGVPLYHLSTIGCIHRKYLFRKFPAFTHFRDGIYSYEVGLLKPDPRIFRLAIERFGVSPERTLYIDDIPANCEAGAREGFITLCYDHRDHTTMEKKMREKLFI